MSRGLIIRTDVGTQIGTGHLMRCLALAQAWHDAGGHATFVMATEAAALEDRLRSERMGIVHLSAEPGSADDAIQTRQLARQKGATWVVVDGYHFGGDYQRIIKDSALRLLFVDDNGHADHYHADIVLNQNIHAHEGLYVNREPYTRLFLGTDYVLLRQEFREWREWKRNIPKVARKMLVTLGGSDPDNQTLKVIQALRQVDVDGLEAVVVIGASNPHFPELQSITRNSKFAIRLAQNVTDMSDLMAWADVAISPGGTTCWELAFMGVPNIVLILADNQQPIAERLDMLGVAMNLGWHETVSSTEIAKAVTQLFVKAEVLVEMAQRGRELVDGNGVGRVLDTLMGQMIILRPVCKDDCRLLWKWANDPDVRAVSFSSEPIPWGQHIHWFQSKLKDPKSIFYIAMDGGGLPIGQVRYDVDGNEAVISVSIDRRFRSKGYGSKTIRVASQKLFNVADVEMIHAYVKPGNRAAIRAFVKAGFQKRETKEMRGHEAIHFALRRDAL